MNARQLMLLIGLTAASTVSAEISYNYVELGYGIIAVDVAEPLDGDGDGPQIYASYEIWGPIKAFAGYSQSDFEKDNITLDDVQFGLGWHHALGKNASIFLDAAYLNTEIDAFGAPTFDQDGFGVTLGYRAENFSPWEFLGTIDYVNVESGVEFGGGISLVYDLTRNFSLSGGAVYFDQSVTAHLGARYFIGYKK